MQKFLYIVFLIPFFYSLQTENNFSTNKEKKQAFDTIRKQVFINNEEKQLPDTNFSVNENSFTVQSTTSLIKNDLLFYTDTFNNTITEFSAENINYIITVSRKDKELFNCKLNKNEVFSEFLLTNYNYITNTTPLKFIAYNRNQKLFIFNLSIGIINLTCLINPKGELLKISKGRFESQNNEFIVSSREIFRPSTGKTLDFINFFRNNFNGEYYVQDITHRYDLISDSLIMLSYFYNYYDERGIKGNLFILDSAYSVIKRTSIVECPNAGFDYHTFGSFLLIFNPKLERVKLYSVKENKFYSLSPPPYIYTKSGLIFDEDKAENDKNIKAITQKQKQFKNTIFFKSSCPDNTTFTFQVDTIQKKIVTCRINKFRE